MNVFLEPTGPIAADAILTGDPKRAMELANRLLERPLMSNLSRGLWGYHGRLESGEGLTVQSTGIGSPSAVAVLEELAAAGVRRAVRVGTAVALDGALELGAALVVGEALGADGVSAALEAPTRVAGDPRLTAACVEAVGAPALMIASTDLHYERRSEGQTGAGGRRRDWLAGGCTAFDLSTAAMFALAPALGVRLAAALVVAEDDSGARLSTAEVDAAVCALGTTLAPTLAGRP